MTAQVFLRVDNYVCICVKYTYSDANGASGGIAMMQNPDRVVGMVIYVNTHFVVTSFTTPTGSQTVFNFYSPTLEMVGLMFGMRLPM